MSLIEEKVLNKDVLNVDDIKVFPVKLFFSVKETKIPTLRRKCTIVFSNQMLRGYITEKSIYIKIAHVKAFL